LRTWEAANRRSNHNLSKDVFFKKKLNIIENVVFISQSLAAVP